MPAPVLQFKRGNAGVAGTVPALRPGEPAISLNNFDFFIGIDTSVANNKFFGSHRYWEREDGTNSLKLKLVSNNGQESVNLRAPTGLGATFTYTLPATGIGNSGKVLTTTGDGVLSWVDSLNSLSIGDIVGGIGTFYNDVGFTSTTNNVLGNENTGAIQVDGGVGIAKNLTVKENFHVGGFSQFVGVSTFTSGVRIENGVQIGITGQNVIDSASGTVTLVGIASTSIRANTVDTVQRSTSANHFLTFVDSDNASATAESLYTDAGISYNPSSNELTVSGDIAVNGGDVTSTAVNFNLINSNATNVNFAGAATALIMGAPTGITTVSNNLTVAGDIRVNGNDIQASDGNTNITLTSNTLTTFAGDIRVNGNDIQASDGNTNITLTSNTLTTFAGDIKVTGNDIQSSTGAVAITLSANDVTIAEDLTVQGNLYVNGNTTQVNTTSLTVEDRTIELGIIDGSPSSTTTWDLGVLFNYGDAGTARKSAMIWEHVDSRFKFAKVLDSDTNGNDASTPQLTITGASNFAPIEIASLWVTDCAGTSQVISCTGTERFLQNITIDAGTF